MKLKNIFASMLLVAACAGFTSCSDDNDWDSDHSLENEFFFGPAQWGYESTKLGSNNVLTFKVAQGATVAVPMHLWSEFTRSFNVDTYYWVVPKPDGEKYYTDPAVNKNQATYDGTVLTRGVDYQVVDKDGNVLEPNADGAFTMVWPNAKKGDKDVFIKALPGGKKGCINLLTHDPAAEEISNLKPETTYQSRTPQYAVRVFSQNYRVTIVIE